MNKNQKDLLLPPAGEAADKVRQLYADLRNLLQKRSNYCNPNMTETHVAEILHVQPRQITYAVRRETGSNFRGLLNSFRLRSACQMLRDPLHDKYTIEEIGLLNGFQSRQAFYIAFHRLFSLTPADYRRQRGATQEEMR